LSFGMDSLKCQTATASPAEPGELLLRLAQGFGCGQSVPASSNRPSSISLPKRGIGVASGSIE
jgi:hypothetical protein